MNFVKILEKFKRARIGVIGDLMLDRYVIGEVERISQEAPVPVVRLKSEECRPGGAANAAANAAALGALVFIFGTVGEDAAGQRLIEMLSQNGVNTEGVVRSKTATIEKTRIIASGQQIVRLDREEERNMPPETIRMISRAILSKLPELDALLISDYAKGVLTPSSARFVIGAAKKRKIQVIAAPKPHNFSLMRGAGVIVPNKKEAEAAAGKEFRNEMELVRAGSALAKRFRSAILITRGSEGMSLFTPPLLARGKGYNGKRRVTAGFENGSVRHIGSAAREVYDVTGAGDTVAAGLALGLACGLPLYEAAVLANAAAGIAVGKRGTATVSWKELAANLHEI